MKKSLLFTLMALFLFTSLAYAEGDKNCGEKGSGSTGTIENGTGTGEQEKTQYRLPVLWLLELLEKEF